MELERLLETELEKLTRALETELEKLDELALFAELVKADALLLAEEAELITLLVEDFRDETELVLLMRELITLTSLLYEVLAILLERLKLLL